ncbi:MAG: LysR family transcriptional regulator [Coriobacteriales bacterium]
MHIEYLREFMVYARILNVSLAAAKLSMSQSTLSRHLQEMERILGFDLVDRTRRSGLTPAGMGFLSDAEHIVRSYDAAVERCAAISQRTQQVIVLQEYGGHPDVSAYLSSLIGHFGVEDDSVEVEWRRYSGYDLEEALVDETLDVAQTVLFADRLENEGARLAGEGIELIPLYREGIAYWMNADEPYAQKGHARLEDLASYAIAMPIGKVFNPMRDAVSDLFASRNLSPSFVYGKTWSISDMPLKTMGKAACVVPPQARWDGVLAGRADMAFVEVEDVDDEFVTCLLLRRHETKKAVIAFRDYLLAHVKP